MKNLVLISAFLISIIGSAQIAVVNATADAQLSIINTQIKMGNTTLAKLLSIQTAAKGEAVQTQSNTLNTLKEAEKMYQLLEKVNSAIKQLKAVNEIKETSQKIIQLSFDMQRVLSNSNLNKNVSNSMISKTVDLANRMQPILEIANKILSSDTFKATDLERLDLLLKVKNQLDAQLEDMQSHSFHSVIINGLSYDSLDID